ncbi:hypothetical protein AX16_006327 [Volvariella volvacea WC 439]|nr:hypothetical protein AX16_006327 [Volvariella volvacea WC 439]
MSKRRWKGIPQRQMSQRKLCFQIATITQEIIRFFGIEDRKVIWELTNAGEFTMQPELMVVGRRGTSFNNGEFPPELDYNACATPISVRSQSWGIEMDRRALQTGIYARSCFKIQRNRRFVYSFFIDENLITLFQFDRKGAIYSKPIRYHDFPEIFVRWLLAAVSSDEAMLGFDMTTKWKGDRRVIQTLDTQGQAVECEVSPMSTNEDASGGIVGSGTTYWQVQNSPNPYVIKEEWRLLSDPREEEFLARAQGLDGVVQLVSYETGEKISAVRWGIMDPKSNDRQLIRIMVSQHSGRFIEHFKSRRELLCSFRDAVAGHRNLWRAGILHRNVNPSTIVYGTESHKPGNRGILVDLDKAMWINQPKPFSKALNRRVEFISLNVLRSGRHSYLDDLQSFFYVLSWICIAYEGPGQRRTTLPQMLQSWSDYTDFAYVKGKSAHHASFDEHFPPNVSPYFGDVFVKLLRELHTALWPASLHTCTQNAEELYNACLSAIDAALEGVETTSSPTVVVPPRAVPPTPVPTPPRPVKTEKRKRSPEQEEIDDFSWKKRLRSSRNNGEKRERGAQEKLDVSWKRRLRSSKASNTMSRTRVH